MSKIFYFILAAMFTAACSSNANVETNVKTANANAVGNSNRTIAATVNQPNTNVETPVNENRYVLKDMSISKENVRVKSGKNIGSQENTPIAGDVGVIAVAAPDNSEVSSAMNKKSQPVETRIFKDHPRLVKVERIDLNNRDVKAYLKNGEVKILPEAEAGNFLTAPAAKIRAAVGVK